MITTPTVLVLGAGASIPYGFPSGYGLRQQIIESSPGSFVPSFATRTSARAEALERRIRGFCDNLKFSAQPSVDAFLEHRSEYMDLGKRLIAFVLIACENTNHLFPKDRDWYQLLWEKMDAGFEKFHENKLAVITFNYDRSLEHFLHTALVRSYRKSEADAAEQLKQIPIVHVYGQLGLLEWQLTEHGYARPYNDERTAETVNIAANGIQILTEGQEESEEFRKAHELLVKAERIFFVGFGYNRTNMERLNLPVLGTEDYDDRRRTAGSCYGLTRAEKGVIENQYQRLKLSDTGYLACEFLRNERCFLLG